MSDGILKQTPAMAEHSHKTIRNAALEEAATFADECAGRVMGMTAQEVSDLLTGLAKHYRALKTVGGGG